MAHTFDICIRGAGIVGRTLALLLARERLRVALVANPTPQAAAAPDVRAYALNTASRTLLESLRSWPDPQHATAVARMDVFGDKDGAVHFDAAAQGAEALAWIVDVPALEQRLAEAVRYQPQVEVVQAPVNAALTVVCEGRASSTRAEFGVDFEVTPYTQHAIATRLECEHPHGQVARQWFLPDGILAFLPLDGPEGRSVAVVWSVDREQVTPLLALEPDALPSGWKPPAKVRWGGSNSPPPALRGRCSRRRRPAGAARCPALAKPRTAGCWRATRPTTSTPWQARA